MDEYEYIEAPGSGHASHGASAESADFDPNDEDSCRRHYILDPNAEWVGPQGAPKVGSLPGTDRKDVLEMKEGTWCAGVGESFKLRIGPNYKKNQKKDFS